MKVLVITRNAWDDTNAIGNTLTNFFEGMDNIEFASIYFRAAAPNNHLCKHYYQTSETEVIKKWFSAKKIGRSFSICDNEKPDKGGMVEKNEKTLIRFIQKYSLKLVYKLSDYIWYSEKWINDNLKDFVEAFSPDIMFAFVKSAPQYYLTIKYLRETFNVPLLSWIADDEYTSLVKNNSLREIQNINYILKESAVVRGCSEEICAYYNTVFNCNAVPLYKGCDLSTPIKNVVNNPIRIVYAGNLLYGRLEIIREIAEIIEGKNVFFEIYSNTSLMSSEVQDYFEQKCCTKYMGRQAYEIVKQQLSAADIVLHVESFEDSQILKTKYSFSTKIIDCMQSGSVLLAVGPKEIASIKYIRRIPGAYVIDNRERLRIELCSLLNDTSSFCKRAGEIREYAQKHHNSTLNSRDLYDTLNKIIKGGL